MARLSALRRQMKMLSATQDVQELMYFLGDSTDSSPVQAFPGARQCPYGY